jgi:hypothetical protein
MRPQLSRGFRTSKAKRGRNIANGGVGQLVTLGLTDEGVEEIYGKRADSVIAGTAVPGGGQAAPVPGAPTAACNDRRALGDGRFRTEMAHGNGV